MLLRTSLWLGLNLVFGSAGGPYKAIVVDTNPPIFVISFSNSSQLAVEKWNFNTMSFTRLSLLKPLVDETMFPVFNLDKGDVDNDGLDDLVLGVGGPGLKGEASSFPGKAVLMRSLGKGKFEKKLELSSESQAKAVRLADLNGDGRLDLIYLARGSAFEGDLPFGKVYIRMGLSSWTFSEPIVLPTVESAYFIEVADLNRDSYPDLIVPSEHSATIDVFFNPGKKAKRSTGDWVKKQLVATKTNPASHLSVNDVKAADFNRDGNVDLISANIGQSALSLFLNNGKGNFSEKIFAAGLNPTFIQVSDLNADGYPDVVVTHWTEKIVSVLLNNRKGGFEVKTDYAAGWGSYGVVVSDLNYDGKPDILTCDYRAGTLTLLFNKGDGTFADGKSLEESIDQTR